MIDLLKSAKFLIFWTAVTVSGANSIQALATSHVPSAKDKLISGIEIKDSSLNACVMDMAAKNGWKTTFEFTDLACRSQKQKIEILDALVDFKNLKSLSLVNHKIADISVIASLGKLRKLNLSYNRDVLNWSQLRNLQDLEELSIRHTNLTHIDFVKGLKKLKRLDLYDKKPVDLNPLENLHELEELYVLGRSEINIQPLLGLKKLKILELGSARVDIEALAQMPHLAYVGFYYPFNDRARDPVEKMYARILKEKNNSYKKAKRSWEDISSIETIRIAMGSTLEPMHFRDDQEQLVGFEVDLVNAFGEYLGKKVEIIDPYQKGSSSLNLLLNKKVDLAVNSLSITEKRHQWITFSLPYFTGRTGVVVNANTPDVIDFPRVTSVRVTNSPLRTHIREHMSEENFNRYFRTNGPIKYVESNADAYSLLRDEKFSNYQTYFHIDDWFAIKKQDPANFRALEFALGKQYYAAAFRKTDFAYNTAWDSFILGIKQSGKYQQIYDKWFANYPLPEVATMPDNGDLARDKRCWAEEPELIWNLEDGISININDNKNDEIVSYLPYLNCHRWAGEGSTNSRKLKQQPHYADAIKPVIAKHYQKKYGPHISELFDKTKDQGRFSRKKFFGALAIEIGIPELMPIYFSERFDTDKRDNKYVLSEFYINHPEKRATLLALYSDYQRNILAKNQDLVWEIDPEFGGQLDGQVSLIDDKTGSKKIVSLSQSSTGRISRYLLQVTKNNADGKPRVKVGNVTGIFDSLKLSNPGSEHTIYDLQGKKSGSFFHRGEIEDLGDGNTIVLKMTTYDLHYDLASNAITGIYLHKSDLEQEINSELNLKLTEFWRSGAKNITYVKGNNDEVYVNYHSRDQDRAWLKRSRDAELKEFDEGAFDSETMHRAMYRFLMDGKLFFGSMTSDGSYPVTVIHLETGKIEKLKNGESFGGSIVPIDDHQLLFCGKADKKYIIDSRDLAGKEINIEIPCPRKSGQFYRFSKPGYFIYSAWSLI